MSQPPYQPVTQLLVRWKAGDQGALEELVPLVHKALRDIARHRLQHERPGRTLQSAARVQALRRVDQRPFDTENPPHFFSGGLALMRQILVDYARSHGAAKQSADHTVELDCPAPCAMRGRGRPGRCAKPALKLDEQQGRIVELRFLGGLATEEIAEVPGISASTVKRGRNAPKAWLTKQMRKGRRGKAEVPKS